MKSYLAPKIVVFLIACLMLSFSSNTYGQRVRNIAPDLLSVNKKFLTAQSIINDISSAGNPNNLEAQREKLITETNSLESRNSNTRKNRPTTSNYHSDINSFWSAYHTTVFKTLYDYLTQVKDRSQQRVDGMNADSFPSKKAEMAQYIQQINTSIDNFGYVLEQTKGYIDTLIPKLQDSTVTEADYTEFTGKTYSENLKYYLNHIIRGFLNTDKIGLDATLDKIAKDYTTINGHDYDALNFTPSDKAYMIGDRVRLLAKSTELKAALDSLKSLNTSMLDKISSSTNYDTEKQKYDTDSQSLIATIVDYNTLLNAYETYFNQSKARAGQVNTETPSTDAGNIPGLNTGLTTQGDTGGPSSGNTGAIDPNPTTNTGLTLPENTGGPALPTQGTTTPANTGSSVDPNTLSNPGPEHRPSPQSKWGSNWEWSWKSDGRGNYTYFINGQRVSYEEFKEAGGYVKGERRPASRRRDRDDDRRDGDRVIDAFRGFFDALR